MVPGRHTCGDVMRVFTQTWDESRGWSGEVPAQADLVLFTGETAHLQDGAAVAALRQRFPGACVAGCSTGTWVLGDQLDDAGMAAVALQLGAVRCRAHAEPVASGADSQAAGRALAQALLAPDLALVLVLSDGSVVNGTRLVAGLTDVLGLGIPVAGGLAGDGARFLTTLTALDGPARTGQVVAVGLYGSALRAASAAVGGWDSFGPARTVTDAEGAVLRGLDHEPALDLYERYLGDEARDLPGSALIYPLRIWPPGRPDLAVVRTVLAIDPHRRTMTFAGDLPMGWQAQLMRGTHDRLVAGAEQAAALVAGLADPVRGERLALLVSCVGRRLLMGQRTGDEVEAVQRTLGHNTRCFGFYSYGELAPHAAGGPCDLHNQTMTVTVIGEALA